MSKITIEIPDTVPVMEIINFAQRCGLQARWTGSTKVECLDRCKVVPLRERVVGFHADRVMVDDPNRPEPPRAA